MIGIVNTNSGNLTSLLYAVKRTGRDCVVLDAPNLDGIRQTILPGQGRFGSVAAHLSAAGWLPVLKDWIAADKPLIGICVGLQILFEASEEDPEARGLGIIPGTVTRLRSPKQPMVGWAETVWKNGEFNPEAAYFVNSFVVRSSAFSIATAEYGENFCAAVKRGNTWACQFHPEKSGEFGMRVLDAWLV